MLNKYFKISTVAVLLFVVTTLLFIGTSSASDSETRMMERTIV